MIYYFSFLQNYTILHHFSASQKCYRLRYRYWVPQCETYYGPSCNVKNTLWNFIIQYYQTFLIQVLFYWKIMRELWHNNSYFIHQTCCMCDVEALTNKYGDNYSLKGHSFSWGESAFSPIRYDQKDKLRLFNSSSSFL